MHNMASHGPLARIDELGLSNLKNKLNDLKDLKAKFLDDFEVRSEEHTSELQSLTNLVCRLLLEKKKKKEEIFKIDKTDTPRNISH